jgi:hypothetical protein
MTSVDISSGIPWETVEQEWRAREFGSLRRSLASLDELKLDEVDDLLFGRDPQENGKPKPTAVLAEAFDAAGRSTDGPPLLALYVYGRCLEKWETSEAYERIEDVLRSLAEAAPELPPSPAAPDKLAALAVGQAQVITQAMSVEDGLRCSCPVAVSERAQEVVQTLDTLWAQESLPEVGVDGPWDLLRADADTSRRYFVAVAAVAEAVRAFADQESPGPIPELEQALAGLDRPFHGDVYESELRAHRAALAALNDTVARPRLWIEDAELTYVYPFALRLEGDGAAAVASALGGAVVKELEKFGLVATSRSVVMNDLWDRYGSVDSDAPHSGALIDLPPLIVETTAREVYPDEIDLIRFTAEVRLSSLGNHYLRIKTHVADEDVHGVNQALRRGSHAMGEESITCVGRNANLKWTTMASYAEEIIGAVAEAFSTTPIVTAGAPFHVVLAARAISVRDPEGAAASATRFNLERAVGASLLFNPVRHLATALEEWVRYPPPVVRNLLGDEGYAGDLVARTDNTTIVYMPSSPEWLVDEYQEMIEFAASLPPLFQIWEDEALQIAGTFDEALGRGQAPDPYGQELTLLEVEQRIRRELARLRSPKLCRTPGQRRFLDELWVAAGYPTLEVELDRRLTLFAERHERMAALRKRSEDRQRRGLEIVLAFLAAISFAGVLGWIDGTFGNSPPHGWLALWFEIAALCVVVLAVSAAVVVRRRKDIPVPQRGTRE